MAKMFFSFDKDFMKTETFWLVHKESGCVRAVGVEFPEKVFCEPRIARNVKCPYCGDFLTMGHLMYKIDDEEKQLALTDVKVYERTYDLKDGK